MGLFGRCNQRHAGVELLKSTGRFLGSYWTRLFSETGVPLRPGDGDVVVAQGDVN